MYLDPVDRTFNRAPDFHVLQFLEADFKKGMDMVPLEDAREAPKYVDMKGPKYVLNGGVYSADELAWLLKKGYVRSEFYGRTDNITDEFVRPRVRYHVTQKGLDSRRWI